jgi:hypothetical protein
VNRAIRPPLAIAASLALVTTSLVWLSSGAQATPSSPAVKFSLASGTATAASTGLSSPAGASSPTGASTRASNVSDLGASGWRVASSATATQSGARISAPGFDASTWLRVANDDAGAPGTEVEALLQNGRCPALDTGTVTVDNLGGQAEAGLSVQAKVYSLSGKVLYAYSVAGISLASQQVRTGVMPPKVPTGQPARVYFVELLLRQHGALVDRNVYWLSTQHDVVNWHQTLDGHRA